MLDAMWPALAVCGWVAVCVITDNGRVAGAEAKEIQTGNKMHPFSRRGINYCNSRTRNRGISPLLGSWVSLLWLDQQIWAQCRNHWLDSLACIKQVIR